MDTLSSIIDSSSSSGSSSGSSSNSNSTNSSSSGSDVNNGGHDDHHSLSIEVEVVDGALLTLSSQSTMTDMARPLCVTTTVSAGT